MSVFPPRRPVAPTTTGRALTLLIVQRELAWRSVAVAATAGVVAAAVVLMFEHSLFISPLLTPEFFERTFGIRSVVPIATGILTAWLITLSLMRRLADDANVRWLEPITAGGAPRRVYPTAVWLGFVFRGILIYAAVATAVSVLERLTGSANATFSPRLVAGAVAVLIDTAAYGLLFGVLVSHRYLTAAAAIVAAGLPFAIVTAAVAGQIPTLPVYLIRSLTLHIPFPVQRAGWDYLAYQLTHAAILLALALWLAPRRIARGG